MTGPLLHYWYGLLENQRFTKNKLVRASPLDMEHLRTSELRLVTLRCSQTANQKLLLDRLVYTPPFTALTIFSVGSQRRVFVCT